MSSSTSAEDLVLVGGENIHWAALHSGLAKFEYLIMETAQEGIRFRLASAGFDLSHHVLRLHAFGRQGDLLVRQDEGRVLWRYVGTHAALPEVLRGETFQGKLDKAKEIDALLWGEDPDKTGHWQEGRVGKANLNYPDASHDWQRVMIRAYPVLSQGRTVAYWTYGLKEYISVVEGASA